MSIYLSLFLSFLKIGGLGFGGGYAILPLILDVAGEFGIIGPSDFSELVALCQTVPGPVSVNAATYVGFYAAGVPGALAATVGFAVPSFVLVYAVMHFLAKFKSSKIIESVFEGIRPMTIGLIATAVVYIGETSVIKGSLISMDFINEGLAYINPVPCIIVVCAAALSGKIKLNPIFIILLSALVGAFVIR